MGEVFKALFLGWCALIGRTKCYILGSLLIFFAVLCWINLIKGFWPDVLSIPFAIFGGLYILVAAFWNHLERD